METNHNSFLAHAAAQIDFQGNSPGRLLLSIILKMLGGKEYQVFCAAGIGVRLQTSVYVIYFEFIVCGGKNFVYRNIFVDLYYATQGQVNRIIEYGRD